MARWMSAAATEESTPPESARSTFSSPTQSRISRTAERMNDSRVHSPVQPQISKTKFRRIVPPRGVCATSGWNCRPITRSRAIAA
jgi:hypothetical protein